MYYGNKYKKHGKDTLIRDEKMYWCPETGILLSRTFNKRVVKEEIIPGSEFWT